MAMFTLSYTVVVAVVVVLLYFARLSLSLSHTPQDILKLNPTRWTTQDIQNAYTKATIQPVDVKDFLPARTGRRYVVVGASGLAGGWIVQHLLMRGERPSAIRMLDIRPNRRTNFAAQGVGFVTADMTDPVSLRNAFNAPWAKDVAGLPLTVFHTAAIIDLNNRAKDVLPALVRVNVGGTHNVLEAAKAAGASIFIFTSSGSVGVKAPKWFSPSWRRYPEHLVQIISNGEPEKSALVTKHEDYYGNYALTKHLAETLVKNADNRSTGFRTGCIRPGNAVYGKGADGVDDVSSMTWRYLNAGGYPSWAHTCMQHLVNVQNVSIAHLLFESKLLSASPKRDLGGRAYCVTDPNPPITFHDMYNMMTSFAKSPMSIPRVPALPFLCLAYLIEAYSNFRRRYATFLPCVAGCLQLCQPAVFNISTIHVAFDTSLARDELGYQGPITTLEGIAEDVMDWNQAWERKQKQKKEQEQEQEQKQREVEVEKEKQKMASQDGEYRFTRDMKYMLSSISASLRQVSARAIFIKSNDHRE